MRFFNILKRLNASNFFSQRSFKITPNFKNKSNYLIDLETEVIDLEVIKKIIKESGILLTDKRVVEFLHVVKDHSDQSLIPSQVLLSLLDQKKYEFFHRIFTGDLAIPDFTSFIDHIRDIYGHCIRNHNGKVASYIPQLAKYNPDYWAVSLCTVDGQRFSIGDSHINFCLQSTSKPVNYALALTELGPFRVHQYVGYEPSGASFNHIHLNVESRPHNPMINAGAIVICSLIKQHYNLPERFDFILKQFQQICGNENVGFNNSIFMSEKSSADRNFALAYYMRENTCFPKNTNLHETLDLYFQLCSLEMNTESMSVMAATLANGGLCPTTEKKVLSSESVRDTLCLMHSCGMYDYSGQFAFKCGLPSKSGVSGGCLLVVPNLMGIGIWSPPLDKQGNSCRSLQFCLELVQRFNFHHFDSLLNHHGKIDPRKKRSM